MKHELKIQSAHFQNKITGDKPMEIRQNNDRGFQKGDLIKYREWNPTTGYTGNGMFCRVTYVTNYMQKENYVVFCDQVISDEEWAISQ